MKEGRKRKKISLNIFILGGIICLCSIFILSLFFIPEFSSFFQKKITGEAINETCTDNCTLGEKQCIGYYSKTCIMGGDGCTVWDSGIFCGGKCLDGECGCPGNCSVAGQTKCDAFNYGVLTCSDIYSNGCLNWIATSFCPNGCLNGVCLNVTSSSSSGGGGSSSTSSSTTNASDDEINENPLFNNETGESSGNGGEIATRNYESSIIQTPSKNISFYVNFDTKNYPAPNISAEQAINYSIFTGQQISNISMNLEFDKVIYLISGTKEGKILTVVPVNAKIEQKIDANSGKMISIKKPWWSFLASGI